MRRRKLREEQEKLIKEEEAKQLKEEEERQERIAKKREELERQRREEEEKFLKEEREKRAKRQQEKLDEEQAMKEEEERRKRQDDDRKARMRKMKEEDEETEQNRREEREKRRKLEEMKANEEREKRRREREREERMLEEEEERRRELRRKREEEAKIRAQKEEEFQAAERRKIEREKKRLEEELRAKEETKKAKEEELRRQGEEFLKREEERRLRRLEERKKWEDDQMSIMGKARQEDRRQDLKADGEIQYTDQELIDTYKHIEARSPEETRRDPRKRPKFSTRLQDRQTVKGTRVRLTCNVITSPNEPPPDIEWYKNGYPVKEDERLKYLYNDGVASLELCNVTRIDSGEYTCTARNRHGRVSTSCDLRVKGEDEQKPSPPTFTTSLRERYINEDDELVLSCHVTGYPQPRITWLKDTDQLPISPRFQTTITPEGVCKLIITSPRAADSGLFTCHAENRVYRDEISASVQVQGKPDMTPDDTESSRFVSELCDQVVEENGTLTLQVEVAGSPQPDVLWLFNGRSLPPSGKIRLSSTGKIHTLTVFQIRPKDLGTYSCKIQNKYGQAYTMSTVSFGIPRTRRGKTISASGEEVEARAPTFVDRPESMMTVFRDEEIRLSCTVQGEPTPRVSWLRGTQDVSNTGRAHKTVKDNTHTLVIRGTQFTDSGTYTVEAKNSQGTVRAYCSIKVKECYRSRSFSPRGSEKYPISIPSPEERRTSGRFIRDVPGKVGPPAAKDVGKTWVSLRWQKPEQTDGVPVTAYKVEAWILGEEARWQELGVSPIASFDAYHLKPDRDYLFRVTPRNKYGWGEATMTPRAIRIGRSIEHPTLPKSLPAQVRCMPGDSISLEAQVTGEPMPEIRWYKDGTYIDLQRYPRFTTATSEGSMHSVFGFVHKVTLKIDDVQLEDEGKYELEAVNTRGRVTSLAKVLTTNDCSVLEAQKRINNSLISLSRLDEVGSMTPQFTMRLRDRRVQSGFPVRLTCQIVGVPKPEIAWYKDDVAISADDSHTIWQEDGHFHTLEISDARHEDAAVYSVRATNPCGSVACRCRLVVDSGLKSYVSPMFLKELEDLSVKEGEEIILQTLIEAYPTVGVVWHRDGQRLRSSRKHCFALDNDGLATLQILNAEYSDGGIYTCTATNEMGHIESLCRVSVACTHPDVTERKAKARMHQAPMFVRKPRTIDAEEGDLVIIECEVVGDPKPSVTWLRDWIKTSVYSDGSRFQEIGTGPVYRLEIPQCRIEDTGAYSILAKNEHGESRAIISLQVYAKGLKAIEGGNVKRGIMEHVPKLVRPLQDVRCCDGDSVTLEALFDAPKSSIVRWEKQGKVLKEGGDIKCDWDGSRARLIIREIYPEDEGEYSCIIFNDMGKTVTSATLVVETDDKENDIIVQMEHRPDLSRRTTPSQSRTSTPSRYSRSPSVHFQREGSAHSWAGVGWRESSLTVSHWRPLSRGSSPLLLARLRTPEPLARSKVRRSHRPKFYYIPHDRIVEEGENVTFQCAIKGYPTPRATWDKDSVKILPGGRIKFEERNEIRMIEIPKVTQQDAGLYRITIENDLGREQATARLVVIKASGNKYAGYVRSWHTAALSSPRFTRTLPPSTIREGSRLTLSADYKGSPTPRPKWYRNDELLPLCDEFPQTYNESRAKLEISSVSTYDAGTYKCVLVSEAGRTECSCQVIVESQKDTGNVAPYFIEGMRDLRVLAGDTVNLSVKVAGTNPVKVVWLRNDEEVIPSDRYHLEATEDGEYSLIIDNVYPDESGIYFCEAYNAYGGRYCFGRLLVIDPLVTKEEEPPRLVGALTPLEVEERAAARFRVTVYGVPEPEVSWFVDGRRMESSPRIQLRKEEDEDGRTVHSLGFLSALESDSGTVSVVAANSRGTETVNTILKVTPRSSAQNGILEGPSDACSVRPSRASVSPSRASPGPKAKSSARDLFLSMDSAYDSGRSSAFSSFSEQDCEAEPKDEGLETHMEEPLLEAEDAGEGPADGGEQEEDTGAHILRGPKDVTATRGQSVTLIARYLGFPEPVVKWLKKEQEISNGGRYNVISDGGVTSLTISDVMPEDSDKYTVVVRNAMSAHATFASLAVEDVPEPPAHKPNISEITATSVTLSWYGPTYDGGCKITGYNVEARKIGKLKWETLISRCHSTSYKVKGLEKGAQYEFRVRAENVHGCSEPSLPSVPVTLEDAKDPVQTNRQAEEESGDLDSTFPKNVVIESGKLFEERYLMHEEVGKGRFGIVYKVTEKLSDQKRAAKVIKCLKTSEKTKVREEISIMNSLRHPKLLQLAAAFERQKDIVMVMEYIAGGELFERVVADDFTLTERDCVLFVRQICEGAEYMHKNNIIHLDLKPENILCVTRTAHQIKLIDFGLARRYNPTEPCRVLFGTPEFIAPEIINYEPISFASDMWSVGVICYVLLSGLSPFMGENDAETFANITRAEYDFEDDAFDAISDHARSFITSLLIKRKEKRLTAEQCLQHPWLVQQEGNMNKTIIPTDKLKKFIIRRKWQKTGNAIRALGRMANLSNRRSSQPSSPTRLSPLLENQPSFPSSTYTSTTSLQHHNYISKTKECTPIRSGSIVSERSDSGISECSVATDENSLHSVNYSVNTSSLNNGCRVSGYIGKTPSLETQISVDSALSEEEYPVKSTFSGSPRKLSREALLAKTSASRSVLSTPSRI